MLPLGLARFSSFLLQFQFVSHAVGGAHVIGSTTLCQFRGQVHDVGMHESTLSKNSVSAPERCSAIAFF